MSSVAVGGSDAGAAVVPGIRMLPELVSRGPLLLRPPGSSRASVIAASSSGSIRATPGGRRSASTAWAGRSRVVVETSRAARQAPLLACRHSQGQGDHAGTTSSFPPSPPYSAAIELEDSADELVLTAQDEPREPAGRARPSADPAAAHRGRGRRPARHGDQPGRPGDDPRPERLAPARSRAIGRARGRRDPPRSRRARRRRSRLVRVGTEDRSGRRDASAARRGRRGERSKLSLSGPPPPPTATRSTSR